MRRALIVALREYVENAKTKGFWLGILILPIMLTVGIEVPGYLERRAVPTRYFVLVDQSGAFEKVISAALDRDYQRQILQALNEYAERNAQTEKVRESRKKTGGELNLETIPAAAADPKKILDEFAESNPRALEFFMDKGGQDFFLAQIRPMLRKDAPPFEAPKPRFSRMDAPREIPLDGPIKEISDKLKPYLLGEKQIELEGQKTKLFAAIIIPPHLEKFLMRPADLSLPSRGEGENIEYWSTNITVDTLIDAVSRAVDEEIRRREFVHAGVDIATVRKVERTRASVATFNPKKEAGEEAVSMADVIRQWAPSGFVYLLWVSIFMVAQMLLNNTIEEKSNRIIEVLLSSITHKELMMGKLLGIVGVGLTMVAAWLVSVVVIILWKAGPEAEWAVELFNILRTSDLLPAFIVYYLLGYFFYAGVFLAVGSICNTVKEAQTYMMPLTLILMVPIMTMAFIPKDPNGTLATVLSWIPFYSPFVMMNRAAADPPMFDLIGTLILMIVSTAVMLWLSSRVFRAGILRTGQPPRIIEIIRWMKG